MYIHLCTCNIHIRRKINNNPIFSGIIHCSIKFKVDIKKGIY